MSENDTCQQTTLGRSFVGISRWKCHPILHHLTATVAVSEVTPSTEVVGVLLAPTTKVVGPFPGRTISDGARGPYLDLSLPWRRRRSGGCHMWLPQRLAGRHLISHRAEARPPRSTCGRVIATWRDACPLSTGGAQMGPVPSSALRPWRRPPRPRC